MLLPRVHYSFLWQLDNCNILCLQSALLSSPLLRCLFPSCFPLLSPCLFFLSTPITSLLMPFFPIFSLVLSLLVLVIGCRSLTTLMRSGGRWVINHLQTSVCASWCIPGDVGVCCVLFSPSSQKCVCVYVCAHAFILRMC